MNYSISFEKAFAETMENEGFYANNPNDRGGETYRGISRRFHPEWEGWATVDACENKKSLRAATLLEDSVKVFYHKNFWQPNRFEQIVNGRLGRKLFDIAVNAGSSTAGLLFQKALNFLGAELKTDGKIGPRTIRAYDNLTPRNDERCLKVVCGLQIAYFVAITEKRPDQKVWARGWLERV